MNQGQMGLCDEICTQTHTFLFGGLGKYMHAHLFMDFIFLDACCMLDIILRLGI